MSAVKLASGYIELTVKKAKDAMKDITTDLTKDGKKAGEAAGKAINDGIVAGTKGSGKAVGDAIQGAVQEGAAKAGKDAGDAIHKGVKKGAQDASKTVQDELSKSGEKAGAEAGKRTGSAMRDAIKDASKELGKEVVSAIPSDTIGDMLGKAVESGLNKAIGGSGWGKAVSGAIGTIAGTAAETWIEGLQKKLSDAGTAADKLKSAFADMGDGQWAKGLTDTLGPAGDTIKSISDAVASLKAHDASGTVKATADGLQSIGQSGAADTLNKINDTASKLKGNLSDASAAMGGFSNSGGGLTGLLGKLGEISTVVAAVVASLNIIKDADHWLENKIPAYKKLDEDFKHNTPLNSAMESIFGNPPPPPAPPMTQEQKDRTSSLILPGYVPPRAKGGVTPAGRIYGPGTGTSDSILGVDANGYATARVSNGEGVVTKDAMDRGGAAVVAALNNGTLPGYDDGTNNVGGAPIPAPQIEVPQATTGAAGQFNDWLNAQQGHQYEYGTLYDCSGFMSQIYNRLTGKQMPRFNTESDLAAYGFVRGSQPGTFQLGIHHGGGDPNSHMAGTLPDGRAVESAGNGVQIGAGAHGAFDKQFEDHWFLPGSEGLGALGGKSGPNLAAALLGGGDASNPLAPTAGTGLPGGPDRLQGYIPAGAGSSGKAGTSFASGLYQMGAQAINGLIDQAASAAATAVSAAATAGSFGAGGQAAGSAAAFAIGLGTQAAKRGVTYGFQMAGIGTDALAEILMPFGVPRLFNTDPTGFMPKLPGMPAAVTTGEKAGLQQTNPNAAAQPGMQPGGPVQPMQLPGQQPLSGPLPKEAKPEGVPATPPPPPNALGGAMGSGPMAAPAPVAPAGPGVGAGIAGAPAAPAPVVPQPAPTPAQAAAPPQSQHPLDILGGMGLIGGYARGGTVGVYDDGGWLMPGGLGINMSNRPEPILNSEQWGDLHAIAGQAMGTPDPKAVGGSNDYSVRIDNVTVTDVNELKNQLDSKQRLQMMRHAGRP